MYKNKSIWKKNKEMKWKYELNSIPIQVQMQTEIKWGITAKKRKQIKHIRHISMWICHTFFDIFLCLVCLLGLFSDTWVLVTHKIWFFFVYFPVFSSLFPPTSHAIFSFQSSFSRYSIKFSFHFILFGGGGGEEGEKVRQLT